MKVADLIKHYDKAFEDAIVDGLDKVLEQELPGKVKTKEQQEAERLKRAFDKAKEPW